MITDQEYDTAEEIIDQAKQAQAAIKQYIREQYEVLAADAVARFIAVANTQIELSGNEKWMDAAQTRLSNFISDSFDGDSIDEALDEYFIPACRGWRGVIDDYEMQETAAYAQQVRSDYTAGIL